MRRAHLPASEELSTDVSGRRILIVEDEFLIASMLEDMLQELGCVIVGIVGRVEQALSFIEAYADRLDAATLDINLGGTTSRDIAAALQARGIPFIFTTGYTDEYHLAGFEHHPRVHKPYQTADIDRALRSLDWSEQTKPLPRE